MALTVAERSRLYRRRKKSGLKCVTLEIDQDETADFLWRKKRIGDLEREDPETIRKALKKYLSERFRAV